MKLHGLPRFSGNNPADCRVDLHLHTRFSLESDLWVLRQAGVGESNTDPETAYRACKERGMTYVTLTDHNTIEGALRLADRDDFFISEEITAYFPDEDVKLHVLALGITERQHQEARQLRRNMYELVSYLHREDILYVLAHPLTRLGGELTPGHIERLMLLFPIWEVHNGSTLERENSFSRRLAEQSTPEKLTELAAKHDLIPLTTGPITFTAGSDDHGGLDIASAFTLTRPVDSIADFLAEVKAGRSRTEGEHGSTQKLAHTMLGLLAHGAARGSDRKNRRRSGGLRALSGWSSLGLLGSAGDDGRKWMQLMSMAIGADSAASLFKTVMSDGELRQSLMSLMIDTFKSGRRGGEVFHEQLFSLLNAVWATGMRSTLSGLSDLNISNFVDKLDVIGRLVALQILLFPHSLAANYHARQRHFLARLDREIFGSPAPGGIAKDSLDLGTGGRGSGMGGVPATAGRNAGPRVGLFTDTYDEVNGVTSILKRLGRYCRQEERPLDIICCGGHSTADAGAVRFPPVTSANLPEYGELDLAIPPVLEIVKYCEEQQMDVIHAATPGPMGMVAFLVSRILQVPLVSSFHTDVPRVIGSITNDKLNEEAAWTFTRWFYRRSDLVFAPSVYTSHDLANHGLDQHKMAILYQGIDSDRFSPAHRTQEWRRRLGGDGNGNGGGDKKIILYAGRLSREKDLGVLADCYLGLSQRRPDAHLALVGDGPIRGELEAVLGGSATFTGWLDGEDLARAFAAADLFVFPGSVDTSGQVILEAQASGLPVVLCDTGGPLENIDPGISGLTAPSRSVPVFTRQIERLLDADGLRASMSRAARNLAKERSWEKVFGDLFETYLDLVNRWQPLSAARPDTGDAETETAMPLEFLLSRGTLAADPSQ